MISLIDAGPGTGKTFSLVYGYLKMSEQLTGQITPTEEQQAIFDYLCSEFKPRSSVCFFAFNKSVKEKLEGALNRTRAKVHTIHGAGYSTLIKKFGFQKKVNYRTEKFIEELAGKPLSRMSYPQKREWYGVKRIVHYLKMEALEPEEEVIEYLRMKYSDLASYHFPDDLIDKASSILDKSSRPNGMVEFADMVWMGKKYAKPLYEVGFVDESQDISNADYQLLTRICKNIIFCGDKNQSIYAFKGASEEMYEKIRERSDAVLPLKVTQRCPQAICDLANKVRPDGIIHGPNTHEAVIEDWDKSSLPEKLVGRINPANSLFVARTNSTLINLAIYFHTKNILFTIVDKDLADEINRFIKSFKADSLSSLQTKLRQWLSRQERCNNDFYIHSCRDKYNYITSIINECQSLDDIGKFLETAFDQDTYGFKLSTCHKAKGLEAQNIFIVNPPLPLDFALHHPIAGPQELNLDFVAKTRSSQDLYYIK